jgi:gliding motility-associated-like protein
VSSTSFSDQQLVEEVLFGTNCVENIVVNNTVSGNFGNADLSYGYFNANNSDFPFEEGLVLSTGRLVNVPGPNDSLSDDDASGWNGDQDLENALGINNTINATIIEFSFVPQANEINFRYLFASEEYRENNAFTCDFSDAFAFLIRPVGGQYENLALVPGTDTPVLVTTVRPEIPGECDAINEEYFGQFNDFESPINFNGQTAILTAETNVTAGQTYEVKLVIADETNFRYDSAVFIEANSFNIGVDLGQDFTLCEGETTNLDITNDDAVAIRWYFEDQLINDTDNNIDVTQTDFGSGTYSVEVDLTSGCTAEDEVFVFFDEIDLPDTLSVSTCVDENGFGIFNLFDVSGQIDVNVQIADFYNTLTDAENNTNEIENPGSYASEISGEIVYVKVLSQGNCTKIQEVTLTGASTELEEVTEIACPNPESNTISFNRSNILNNVANANGVNLQSVSLYNSENDAIAQQNEITTGFIEIETALLPLTIFGRIDSGSSCLGVAPIVLQQTESLQFVDDTLEFLLCDNDNFGLTLSGSLFQPQGTITYLWNTGDTTENIVVSEPGEYFVDVTSVQNINGQEVVCSSTKFFNVSLSGLPEVTFTQTGFVGNDNQLIITAEGTGDYEYALNNSGYVDHNVFDIETTENKIFVRDKNGCGEVSINFVALRIPEFFTPNGDGFNDYWQIEGIRQSENDIKVIYIFDRYGKLIYEVSPQQIGWDGTYKGSPVPSQDYWYKIELVSGNSISGNLTLKR